MGEGILTLKKKAFWAHIFATVLGFLIILIVAQILEAAYTVIDKKWGKR